MSGDKPDAPAHPIDVFLTRLDRNDEEADAATRKTQALASLSALAKHLMEQPDAPLPHEVVTELRLGLIAYLYVHDIIKAVPETLEPRELDPFPGYWELIAKARRQVRKGLSFTLDDAFGITKPKLRGRPTSPDETHRHERLFLMAFYDHEVVQEIQTQIEALKKAAKCVGLRVYEPDSLDHEYRLWRKRYFEWLCWLFDLI